MPRVRAVTLRHVLDFRCSGPDCPESCCRVGWRVAVDEGHYRKLKRALGDDAFARLVQPVEPGRRSRATFGLLVLDERGACRQLDDQGWCRIHSRFGADMLGDTCAIYPRVPSLVGQRQELQLVLSCPESARGALLAEGATDLVEAPPGLFPAERKDTLRVLPERPADPYAARFDDVRGAAYELLSAREWPVASRVAFTLALAAELGEFFYPRSDRYSDERFEAALAAAQRDDMREALHRRLLAGGRDEDARMAPHFVLEMLAARLAVPAQPSFLRVALAALADCAPAGEGQRRPIEVAGGMDFPASSTTASVDAVAAEHRRRVAALSPALLERMEVYFENFARAYWIRDWYFHAPSLLAHAQGLALRMAVLRFLLLGHPSAAQAMVHPDAGEAVRLLDAAAVEAVYGFSRAMEHQDDLFENVMRTFERADMHSLRHGMSLLRF